MTYNTELAAEAQMKYCLDNKMPIFSPSSGQCYKCRQDIYDSEGGISVEDAGLKHITGCPHCNFSYCD